MWKNEKIHKLDNIVNIRSEMKKRKKKVVFTNGCFDILHSGHVYLFREAKKLGDVLIVAVNDDISIENIKGPSRPIFPLRERLEVLEAIKFIDFLISFSEKTPQKVIASILPDILVKGGDWKLDEIVGRREVEEMGGRVVIIPYQEGSSGTGVIEKIVKSEK